MGFNDRQQGLARAQFVVPLSRVSSQPRVEPYRVGPQGARGRPESAKRAIGAAAIVHSPEIFDIRAVLR